MKLSKLKNIKKFYLVNRETEEIEVCELISFNMYPLKYGYLKISDSNLHSLKESDLDNMFLNIEEAKDSLYNLFSIVS